MKAASSAKRKASKKQRRCWKKWRLPWDTSRPDLFHPYLIIIIGKTAGPFIAGIDIGTGSTKAVALDTSGTVAATAQHFYPTQHPQPGWSEQHPEAIWDAFCNTLRDLVEQCGRAPDAVVLSSAMHSLILVDEKGQPLAPMMLWSDTRSAAIAENLKNDPESIRLYQATGTPVHAMSPLCKIAWLRNQQQPIFEAAHKFISIKEYIWHRLFGVYEIDDSIASATGLFDILQLRWHEPALAFCGIGAERLSIPVRTHHRRTIPVGSNPAFIMGVPFIIGASDGCLANLGSFATNKQTAALTIGTSGAVRICSAHPITEPEAMLFNYRLDEQTFICGGPLSNGGNVLEWLLRKFLQTGDPNPEAYNRLFARIEKIPAGSDGLLFLPYLHGERAPVWDARASGCYFGIRHGHTQDHFLRAALEGVCYALCHILHYLEKESGAIDQLHVSGGFINSRLWMQLLADVAGKKLCLIQSEDASATGAALLGIRVLDWNDPSDILIANSRFLHPDMQLHALYHQYFSIYKELYAGMKNSMHRLHAITTGPEK